MRPRRSLSVKFVQLGQVSRYQNRINFNVASLNFKNWSFRFLNLALLSVLAIGILYFVIQANQIASKKMLLDNLNNSMRSIYTNRLLGLSLFGANIQEIKVNLNMVDVDTLHVVTLSPDIFALGSFDNLDR